MTAGAGVARYVAGRVGRTVLVVWAAFTVTFLVLRLLPGDPVALYLKGTNGYGEVTDADVAAARAALGFDRPWPAQYVTTLFDALRGDLGESIRTRQPVAEMIVGALPPTLQVGALGLLLSLLGGLALGVAANLASSPAARQLLRSLPALAISVPTFWLGLVLIQVFALQLRLVPSLGGSGFSSVILPAVTLAVPGAALVAQVLGKSLHDTLREPWAETVRATGAGTARLVLGRGLRNAAIPAVTVSGLLVGGMIGGAVVVETVFARPGMGRITQSAVAAQDLPVVQGVVVVAATVFALVTLAVDLLYPVLDPRIRSTGRLVPG
ncbi:ABC transporter permease [Pseudonocardia nematodicida]|uniref:ABC transporter permease n=1 Tax=Pseudonocardia nematodicida TaxID=1206997 RepID=A0ABV1KGU1_9PSEU